MNYRRREFLAAAGAAGLWTVSATGAEKTESSAPASKTADEVSPGEDLMREHGVLKRILLVYGEVIRRVDAQEAVPPKPLYDAADIIRTFVEDYHEKLEEDHLFPRFRKADVLVDLVDVLQAQHQAGRKLTDTTLRLANGRALRSADDRRTLVESLRAFIRMYSPHEAREDTVLFPAFHELVSQNEYDSLGEDFERLENKLFGQDGFEKNVARVTTIEKALDIYDLAQFTPRQHGP